MIAGSLEAAAWTCDGSTATRLSVAVDCSTLPHSAASGGEVSWSGDTAYYGIM